MPTALNSLIEAALPYYWNPSLTYHNWDHIDDVVRAHTELWGSPESAVLLAMVYHDCVYVPGAEAGVNEELSALTFLREFNRLRPTWSDLSVASGFVCELILATRVSNHVSPDYLPRTQSEARVLDCDLAGFGLPFPEFVARQDRVLIEFEGPNADLNALRSKAAKFLQQFVFPERVSIYHTFEARKAWEKQAVDNIHTYCHRWLNATTP